MKELKKLSLIVVSLLFSVTLAFAAGKPISIFLLRAEPLPEQGHRLLQPTTPPGK